MYEVLVFLFKMLVILAFAPTSLMPLPATLPHRKSIDRALIVFVSGS